MQDSTSPRVSIVIRCFNEAAHIGRLLTGISRQDVTDVEVIVVDSGSTDETLAIASKFPVQIVHIKPEDFSFGYALNVGCEASRGAILLFASAHVYPVRKDWLTEMLKPFDDEKTGLVYGRQIGNELSQFSERQIFAQWFPAISVANQSNYFCNNANAAIRRSLWKNFRYDESLTGLEDLEMANRLQNEGQRIAYQAEATVVHVHQESLAKTYNRYRREAIALSRILPDQRFNLFDFVRLYVGNVASDVYHACQQAILREEFCSIILFRLMQFWGTYRGSNSREQITAELRQRFYYPNTFQRRDGATEAASDPAYIDYTRENPRSDDQQT